MIVHKAWLQQGLRFKGIRSSAVEWQREGWYLFGFIPLYVRDIGLRGRY